MYEAATDLDPLSLTALASQEGMSALLAEAAREPKHRRPALAALGYTRRLAAVESLAPIALGDDAESRTIAFDAIGELAATVHPHEDPEDLLELRRGCERLSAFVTAGKGETGTRHRALSALRALRQFGCSAPEGEAP